MAKNKEEKTNVMRTLEQKKIAYTAKTYPHGEGDAIDGVSVARAVGEKSVVMLPQKELLPLTGYVHGGCSPVGMKKQFPTVFHETAESLPQVAVSAGKIGYQVVCDPKDLMALLRAGLANLIVE